MSDNHTSSEDRDQIRALLASYCHCLDDGRFDDWGALYTDDATFSVMGQVHAGRDAMVGWIAGVQGPDARGKHLISEPLIELAGDRAAVRTDYAFVGKADKGLQVMSAGRYIDEVVRTDTGWRFAARRIVFLGESE